MSNVLLTGLQISVAHLCSRFASCWSPCSSMAKQTFSEKKTCIARKREWGLQLSNRWPCRDLGFIHSTAWESWTSLYEKSCLLQLPHNVSPKGSLIKSVSCGYLAHCGNHPAIKEATKTHFAPRMRCFSWVRHQRIEQSTASPQKPLSSNQSPRCS